MLHFKKRGITAGKGFTPYLKPRHSNAHMRIHTRLPESRGTALIAKRKKVTLRYLDLQRSISAAQNAFSSDAVPNFAHEFACNNPNDVDISGGGVATTGYTLFKTNYKTEKVSASRMNVKFYNKSPFPLIVFAYIKAARTPSLPYKTRSQILKGSRAVWAIIPGAAQDPSFLEGVGLGAARTTSLSLAWSIKEDKGDHSFDPLVNPPLPGQGTNQWNMTNTDISDDHLWTYVVGSMFLSADAGSTSSHLIVPLEVRIDQDVEFAQPDLDLD